MTSTGFLMVATSSGLSGGGGEPHFGIDCPPTHPSAELVRQHPHQETVHLGTGADAPVCPRPVGPTRLALLLGAIEAIAALRLSEPGLSPSQRNTVISIHSYASWYSAAAQLGPSHPQAAGPCPPNVSGEGPAPLPPTGAAAPAQPFDPPSAATATVSAPPPHLRVGGAADLPPLHQGGLLQREAVDVWPRWSTSPPVSREPGKRPPSADPSSPSIPTASEPSLGGGDAWLGRAAAAC